MGLGIFNGICAIDLDHCIDADGNYSQTAAEIIAMMHSYTELSPSGTGVHILFRAEGFHYDTNRYYIMNRQAVIEVYVAGATNKYVTITDQPCTAYGSGDRSDELQQVLERFMVRERITATNAINAGNSDMTTDQLLEKAFSSRRGEAIRRLWSGDITGYPSNSEADQALCSHLAFWTGRDAGMMDAMFRQSGLMRDKWDRKQANSTYGQITIQTAIRNCTEVYTPKGAAAGAACTRARNSARGRATPDERQPMLALAERSQHSPCGWDGRHRGTEVPSGEAANTPE